MTTLSNRQRKRARDNARRDRLRRIEPLARAVVAATKAQDWDRFAAAISDLDAELQPRLHVVADA